MFRTIYGLIFIIFSGSIVGMAFLAPVIQELFGYPNGENIYALLMELKYVLVKLNVSVVNVLCYNFLT